MAHKSFILFDSKNGVLNQSLGNLNQGINQNWKLTSAKSWKQTQHSLNELNDRLFPVNASDENVAVDDILKLNKVIDQKNERGKELATFWTMLMQKGWKVDEEVVEMNQNLEL